MGARLRDVAQLLLPLVSATSFTVADRGSAFSSLHVKVDAGEGIKAEPGSLVSYKGGLRLSIQADSSWFGRMFAGEAPYMTRLDADAEAGGECIMCPRELGSIETKALLSDEVLFLKAGSFLAADCEIDHERGPRHDGTCAALRYRAALPCSSRPRHVRLQRPRWAAPLLAGGGREALRRQRARGGLVA
jgi:hypothetical protein